MTNEVTAPSSPRSASRGMNVTLWVLQGIAALGFAFSGVMKLSGSPQALGFFEVMGTASWMPYVIGVLEILGAIGLLVPKLSGIAASAFVALLIGALISHAIWGGFPVPALILLVLSAVIAYGRRATMSALFASGSRR